MAKVAEASSPNSPDVELGVPENDVGLPDRHVHSKAMLETLGHPPGYQDGEEFTSDHVKYFLRAMVKQNEEILGEMDAHTQVPRAPMAWGETGVSWKNVGFKVTNPTTKAEKVILQNCWGNVKAGSLVALMGPSGCGKSTLMDIIAQKKTTAFEGEIFCNGHNVVGDPFFKRYASYVPQADLMHPTLTVRETVAVDQFLKNPPPKNISADPQVRMLMLDMILSSIGLSHIKDTYIGGPSLRGVSGGQKRRVTLARGMVSGAQLMFADEPTSGLSATDAETCIKALRFLCARLGLTCIVVIHQPRVEVAELFDELVMLTANPTAYGGSTVYNGPMSAALEYCNRVGYPVPERANIMDWMMDIISPGYKHMLVKSGKKQMDESVKDLVEFFKANRQPVLEAEVAAAIAKGGKHPKDLTVRKWEKAAAVVNTEMSRHIPNTRPNSVYPVGPLMQMYILFKVKARLIRRDAKGVRLQFMMSVLQAVLLGIAFLDIASEPEIMHMQFLFLVMQMSVIGGMQVMPNLVDARFIMKKEVHEGLYSVGAWLTVNAILDGVMTLMSSSVFVVVVYIFGGMDWGDFPTFYLWLLLIIMVMDSYYAFIASIAKSGELAQVTAMPLMIMFMMYNGFLVTKATVPDFMVWALYSSPFYYTISNLARDLYDVPASECPGCNLVMTTYGFDDAPDKVVGYIVLLSLFVVFRLGQVYGLIFLNNPQH